MVKGPNWNHWNACEVVTTREAVALSLNMDPGKLLRTHAGKRGTSRDEHSERMELLHRACQNDDSRFYLPDDIYGGFREFEDRKVRPAAVRAYFAEKGFSVPAEWKVVGAPEPRAGCGGWPWGAHETELLRCQRAAAVKFWVNYDPADVSTAPTNSEVAEWLRSEHGLSKITAAAIARILRADGLPSGPRRS